MVRIMGHDASMASRKEDGLSVVAGLVEFEAPPGWVPVAAFSGRRDAQDAGLAILAMGEAYWMMPHEGRFVICVKEVRVAAVQAELREVARLSRNRPRAGVASPHEFHFGWISFLIYGLLLAAFFYGQSRMDLVPSGGVDAVKIIGEGQIWRAMTALTLHADIVHLASNTVAGAGFAFFVLRFFGVAAGWSMILLAGTAGNLLNAWVHYPEAHYSIGASTAVFGALGLVTGIGLWASWTQPGQNWTLPRWLLPAFGGLTLLGMLGVGEGPAGQIDVAAHISGFLCGTLIGFLAALRQSFFIRLQRYGSWLGLLLLGLIGLAWLLAFLP